MLGETLETLYALHLVQKPSEDSYLLHPLIREFLCDKRKTSPELEQAQTNAFCAAMVNLAREKIPNDLTQAQAQAVAPLIPHLAEVADHWIPALGDDELIWPFIGLGYFYQGQGLYALAEP